MQINRLFEIVYLLMDKKSMTAREPVALPKMWYALDVLVI